MTTATPRPVLHFTPKQHWMNDPNGLIFHKGLYHLFFQHNPHANEHGNMSWGHATSPDLATWTEQHIAILHDDVDDIFSGSIVWDEHNTSGLGANGAGPLVAIYTAAARTADHQAQALAISHDDGATWQKHPGNPVLDLGTDDFRDPKVFRYSDGTDAWWVMVAVAARSRQVLIHCSTNLIEWTRTGQYGPAGSVEGFWECPDLFPLPIDGGTDDVAWVMLISVADGAIAGGNGTQYVIGDFDGEQFHAHHEPPTVSGTGGELADLDWLDYGPDCYAGVTFSGLPDDQRTLIAWMNNWRYAQTLPTTPWRGSMSLPRRLTLNRTAVGLQLRQAPVLPAAVFHHTSDVLLDTASSDEFALPLCGAAILRIPAPESTVTVTLSAAEHVALRLEYDPKTEQLTVHRPTTEALGPSFASHQQVPVPMQHGDVALQILVDSTSVEIFTGDTVAISHLVLEPHPWTLTVQSQGSAGRATIGIVTHEADPTAATVEAGNA